MAKSKTKKKMSEGSRRPSYSKIHNKDPDLEAGSTTAESKEKDTVAQKVEEISTALRSIIMLAFNLMIIQSQMQI